MEYLIPIVINTVIPDKTNLVYLQIRTVMKGRMMNKGRKQRKGKRTNSGKMWTVEENVGKN